MEEQENWKENDQFCPQQEATFSFETIYIFTYALAFINNLLHIGEEETNFLAWHFDAA